jgi:hypothetical protein
MRQGQAARVEVAIARLAALKETLATELHGPGHPQVEGIETSDLMSVDLRGDAFKINGYSEHEQIVAPQAKWEFNVLPVRAGVQTLAGTRVPATAGHRAYTPYASGRGQHNRLARNGHGRWHPRDQAGRHRMTPGGPRVRRSERKVRDNMVGNATGRARLDELLVSAGNPGRPCSCRVRTSAARPARMPSIVRRYRSRPGQSRAGPLTRPAGLPRRCPRGGLP